MLKRPSTRSKTSKDQLILNLVPMLDALMTLIIFLLFSLSFLAIVSIESPVPVSTKAEAQKNIKKKPLQLTITVDQNLVQIWSPFGRIKTKKIAHIDGLPDLIAVHNELIKVKEKFPNEKQIVFMPHAGTNYDTLVGLMDSMRSLETTDPPIFIKSKKSDLDIEAKYLFPNIVFGNLLGDS